MKVDDYVTSSIATVKLLLRRTRQLSYQY